MDAYYYRRIYKLIVETKYVEKAELTDEEVWLRAYCAAITNNNIHDWSETSDIALEEFKERFRND